MRKKTYIVNFHFKAKTFCKEYHSFKCFSAVIVCVTFCAIILSVGLNLAKDLQQWGVIKILRNAMS